MRPTPWRLLESWAIWYWHLSNNRDNIYWTNRNGNGVSSDHCYERTLQMDLETVEWVCGWQIVEKVSFHCLQDLQRRVPRAGHPSILRSDGHLSEFKGSDAFYGVGFSIPLKEARQYTLDAQSSFERNHRFKGVFRTYQRSQNCGPPSSQLLRERNEILCELERPDCSNYLVQWSFRRLENGFKGFDSFQCSRTLRAIRHLKVLRSI